MIPKKYTFFKHLLLLFSILGIYFSGLSTSLKISEDKFKDVSKQQSSFYHSTDSSKHQTHQNSFRWVVDINEIDFIESEEIEKQNRFFSKTLHTSNLSSEKKQLSCFHFSENLTRNYTSLYILYCSLKIHLL